ncbi:stage II sporulation protein P [Paenibacillus eucommiae]|uniref:Stage II sporulation protein P n=1 Tax=Paenibacillus eucommiae TaxID=1355755 RepID=A0ABS4ISW4_9BACL|nr:stage II sporulation protein P [Paenibacillus eucommiae]MBP1989966.1 stage II sporulation protein P [Paenibacillus eucommiae]
MKIDGAGFIQLFRTFLMIMLITFLSTVLLGAALAAFNPAYKIPTGKAANIPTQIFSSVLSLEIPLYQTETHAFEGKNIANFMLKFLLNVDLKDKKTLMAGIIPEMKINNATLLHPGDYGDERIDYPGNDERNFAESNPPANIEPEETATETPDSHDIPPVNPTDNETKTPVDINHAEAEILIYHSHNRESWLPELPHITKEFLAFDKEKNVTLLGDRLAKQLSDYGIKSLHDSTDYQVVYGKDFKTTESYLYSRKNVKEAMIVNKEIKYLFDIHRDSGPRKATTTIINGKDYAQLYIIIGAENPKWKENTEFAKEFIDILNKKYPGLSKGIFAKDHSQGNGVYNQDLSINSMIIEVGGVNNTLEESYRTIDALSDVISDFYKSKKNITEVNSVL